MLQITFWYTYSIHIFVRCDYIFSFRINLILFFFLYFILCYMTRNININLLIKYLRQNDQESYRSFLSFINCIINRLPIVFIRYISDTIEKKSMSIFRRNHNWNLIQFLKIMITMPNNINVYKYCDSQYSIDMNRILRR